MGRMSRWLPALLLCASVLSGAPPRKSAASASPAQRWLTALTPRQRAAQLVIIKSTGVLPPTRSRSYRAFLKSVQTDGVGGIIINNRVTRTGAVNAEPFEIVSFVNRMQKLARVPLLIGGDFERGASMRVAGTIKYPHAMAFAATGSPEFSRELGRATAREARALGVHWIYAPDADVNNNPQNPVINIRSYGEDPQLVAQHVQAYVEGARSDPAHPVLVTLKHFPGHGDTAVDSHAGMPRLDADRPRLNRVELVPFRAGIAAGVDSVMTAHIALPAVDPSGEPATVSKPVITGLLRGELGFDGIVSTDAMDMAGLTARYQPGEAAVRALEAGVDVLLIPSDPEAAIQGILAAVRSGRLKQSRIDASVRKILAAKLRLGLDKNRYVAPETLPDALDAQGAAEKAQQIASRAVTLIRDKAGLLPLAKNANACVLLLVERQGNTHGQAFLDEMALRAPRIPVRLLDPQTPTVTPPAECGTIVLGAYAQSGGYGERNAPLPGNHPELVSELARSGKPIILIGLGNPYLIRAFPDISTYFTTYSPAATSETAAVRALFGDSPMTGKKVVTVE
jgi:beta-N-acetylhexosaminidase